MYKLFNKFIIYSLLSAGLSCPLAYSMDNSSFDYTLGNSEEITLDEQDIITEESKPEAKIDIDTKQSQAMPPVEVIDTSIPVEPKTSDNTQLSEEGEKTAVDEKNGLEEKTVENIEIKQLKIDDPNSEEKVIPVVEKDFQKKLIRVLLSNKGSFDQNEIILSAEKELFITSNENLITSSNTPVKITVQGDYFLVNANGVINKVLKNQTIIASTDNTPLIIENSIKAKKTAKYLGQIEISLSKSGKLNAINIIDIEDYIKGVVPNEMPVHFGLEALKAQAISARGYAYRDTTSKKGNYDVCDTTGSQVYNGFNSYDSIASQAVDETMGQFALYDGDIILSLYSSTSGGHTESYENAFSKNGIDTKFPADPIPYLTGVPDYDYDVDLSREKNVKDFYSSRPESFESNSPKFRWVYSWKKEELEQILIKNLMKFSSSKFVIPSLKNPEDFGSIINIDIPRRGVSGKAMYVRITTNKGVFAIAKEITIRQIFEYNNKWLPSANIVFETISDGKNIVGYKVIGGGFGHGVGLSQYGASGMAKKGHTYDEILKHYYSGISIGSYPVKCDLKNIQNCKATFYLKDKNAKLLLNYSHKPHNLTFEINGQKIAINAQNFDKKLGQVEIKKFLKKGINSIKLVEADTSMLDFIPNEVKFYVELEGKNEK